MGNVNPVGYKANYGGLSAFDIKPEGYIGKAVGDTLDYYQKDKEAKSIQRYREQQREKLQQDMALKESQQKGDIAYLNAIDKKEYANQPSDLDKSFTQSYLDAQARDAGEDELSFLRQDYQKHEGTATADYLDKFKPKYSAENVGANTLGDYLTQQQRDITNVQTEARDAQNKTYQDATTGLAQDKAMKTEKKTEPYFDKASGEWKQDYQALQPDGTYSTDTKQVAPPKSTDAKSKSKKEIDHLNYISGKTGIPIRDLYEIPAVKQNLIDMRDSESLSEWKLPSGVKGNIPRNKGESHKIGGIEFTSQPVKTKTGKWQSESHPTTTPKMYKNLEDYTDHLDENGQEKYADTLREANYNLGIDKYEQDKVFNLVYALTGGNEDLMTKSFQDLRNANVRSGGLGSFLATIMPHMLDYNDLPSDYSNKSTAEKKRAKENVLANLFKEGRLKILNKQGEGGVKDNGYYNYVITKPDGSAVPKAETKSYMQEIANNQASRNYFSKQAQGSGTINKPLSTQLEEQADRRDKGSRRNLSDNFKKYQNLVLQNKNIDNKARNEALAELHKMNREGVFDGTSK